MSKSILVAASLVSLLLLVTTGCNSDEFLYGRPADTTIAMDSRSAIAMATRSALSKLPEVSFDTTIAMASLDGFRIQMSARMAKQVAKERGYRINSSMSKITFDDIIEAGSIAPSTYPIYLKRDHETIDLGFEYGKVMRVSHSHMFSQRQQAENLLASYLRRYPQLELSNKGESVQSYIYEPNKLAFLIVSIQMFSENVRNVSISIYDGNYRQSKINIEAYEKIDAIRREY